MFQALTLPFKSPFHSSTVSRRPSLPSFQSQRSTATFRSRAAVQEFTDNAGLFASGKAGSLYEVLRVKENASPMEIKTAYRRLAKLHHPDASPSDGRHFIEIHSAYETLSDPDARAIYDLSLGLRQRQRRLSSPTFGFRTEDRRPGFYTTGRWETDQCW
ncbi:hypothetical protein Nepgr_026900 [Nepenthes gracilis]|uniref:J domain-containing protein n=1 Tax=Nepenthes gracilis TaxID=150966 RepID=A0AAD3T907_NEPGR|nr:hypothetical protein Nepgr_026900 [Nepenthes gracilis]